MTRNALINRLTLALALAGTVLASAATHGSVPLLAGVPTLDEMASDWKNAAELEQFPSIHNFNGQMLVNKDFASISWLASPPFCR
jgi:ribonuclease PH